MQKSKRWLARFGAPVVFLFLVMWLGLMERDTFVSALFDPNLNPPAVATTATQGPTDITFSQAATENSDATPEVVYDLSGLPVLTDYSLVLDADPHTFQGALPQHELEKYVVEKGDTPNGIAERFGIKPETLLGGNEFLSEESSLLQVGVELVILPIDGVLHKVEPGDTLEGLATKYQVPLEDIIAYAPNNLAFPYRLYPDTEILVPGAVREVFVWNPPSLPSVVGGNAYWDSRAAPIVVGTGTFIWPVGGRNISQYYWYGHPALDIALLEGTPTYASDTGTVTYAAWSPYCFGNLIVINHGNGYETFYAHLSGINVYPGQVVYQGNLIGYTGNTGCSSGPHIHFEIREQGVRRDPLSGYLP